MHFSISDTQEFVDSVGSTYIGYNVHINGLFHCTVRYKQLHNLHEQLVKELDIPLPLFPPKRFFPLTISQQEERRLALEKYIQAIGQNGKINNSELLNGFLLNAQQETFGKPSDDNQLDVFLMNNYQIKLTVSTGEPSSQVLKKIYQQIGLHERYYSYFALYIVLEDDNNINVLRKLQDFESPFITYKTIHSTKAKVVLGKNYWNIEYDLELSNDPTALNLLYVQAISEVNRGWIIVTSELKNRLSNLEKHEEKREYLDMTRSLKYYGYIQFAPCFCDYPQAGSKILVAIGRNELNFRIWTTGEEYDEATFKVSRIRCWRITTLQNGTDRCEDTNDFSLELSFEYLMNKNQLQWITISSEQAILMSVCLQSMIDELLYKSIGSNKTQQATGKSWTYVTRDGQSRITMKPPTENINETQKIDEIDSNIKPEPIIKKLAHRLSSVTTRKTGDIKNLTVKVHTNNTIHSNLMENNAFNVIGDEDL